MRKTGNAMAFSKVCCESIINAALKDLNHSQSVIKKYLTDDSEVASKFVAFATATRQNAVEILTQMFDADDRYALIKALTEGKHLEGLDLSNDEQFKAELIVASIGQTITLLNYKPYLNTIEFQVIKGF